MLREPCVETFGRWPVVTIVQLDQGRASRPIQGPMASATRDSWGPIFGGVQLRESVTFASTQTALITSPADELARISVLTAPRSSIHHGVVVTLPELIHQLSAVSFAHAKYLLLTANCRYALDV